MTRTAASAWRSAERRKERRHFPQDVTLLRDEQVVAGMPPAEHAGLRDAAFERSRLPFGHRLVELFKVSGHDIVRAREDRQRWHANPGELLRAREDRPCGCRLSARLPLFGAGENDA